MVKTTSSLIRHLLHLIPPPPTQPQAHPHLPSSSSSSSSSSTHQLTKPQSFPRRRAVVSLLTLAAAASTPFAPLFLETSRLCWAEPLPPQFVELPDSGGVKALDIRVGSGDIPVTGDKVAIHYYGRLAAKQGWRFDSTYDHKDVSGDPIPFVFVLGSGKVISGIEAAVRSMKVGGVRRVIIPPSEGYQNPSQEPLPPNIFDRQRLFTTIFNPTRLANGEGSTLGTLIFDIELVSTRHQ